MNSRIFFAVIALALLGWPAPTLAQEPTAQPAASASQNQEIEVPESYVERMRNAGAVLDVTLKEAIRLALTNNLEIAIENFNEDLSREQIIRTRGFYDPSVAFTVGWNSSERPTTSTLDAGGGIPINISDGFFFNSNLRQNVAGGGALDISFDNNRFDTNSTFSFINPRFSSNFDVNFTQPLLKGFRKTNTRRQIKLFNLDTQIDDTSFQQRVAEIVQQVQVQYWELVYSVENYETQRKSMELAIVQHRNNRKRVQIGVMAPIEITSSHAEVARREQSLIQSEVQIINAQNSLKRLLAAEPQASIWGVTLLPSDRPVMKDVVITLKDAINTATQNRPELERIILEVEKNEVNRSFYKTDGKPAVNLRANFGSLGSSGLVTQRLPIDLNGDGVPDAFTDPTPNPNDPRFGDFRNAWSQAFKFDFTAWGLFVDVEIPLRNRTNAADMAMVNIRERQLQSTIKNQQQMIIVEVRNAFETIVTRKKSLEAARVARELAEEQLQGENKRFEAGLSTNFEVLRFQRDLAENQVLELRARIDYQLALIALEKAMYTIIEDSDIVLARGG